MNWRKSISAAALLVAGTIIGPPAASAQSFQNYRCADGTQFLVAFFPYDERAHMQIDGNPVTLYKRPAFSGLRYSGGGVTWKVTKGGASTVRHAGRPVTACELS